MNPASFMLIAGEASGDLLAAELIGALREKVLTESSDPTSDAQPLRTALAPHFFGAGGPRMAAAGAALAFDLTQHSAIGISEVLKNYLKYRRLFLHLLKLAIERQPDVIIGVDYGGFNLRFGRAIKRFVRARHSRFNNWNPKLVQFVSPQVWASRPSRAQTLADNYDLLLSIFPFEKNWYARRVPKLRVEFVGHPMVGRFNLVGTRSNASKTSGDDVKFRDALERIPNVLLLPGSRADELRRHLPLVTGVFELMRRDLPGLHAKMIVPDDALAQLIKSYGLPCGLELRVGGIPDALAEADLAITKSGTITMECAMFGVPAVVFYKTSWPTYLIGKQILTVDHIAMPNLLAAEEVLPEFIQDMATPENVARAALELLRDGARRQVVKMKLAKLVGSLGGSGASFRAAESIVNLLR